MIVPVIFGIVGMAVLIGLGIWQLQRMEWKNAVIAVVAKRLTAEPISIPADANYDRDHYLRATATGRISGKEIHVLSSQKLAGPGFQIISRMETEAGPILVDLGFVRETAKNDTRPVGEFTVVGNLLWPDDIDDGYTPDPDIVNNFWFARDLPAMAKHLSTQPVLLVASEITPQVAGMPRPMTVASNLPNSHFEYAVTWFMMAVAWMGMTLYLLWRIRQKTV